MGLAGQIADRRFGFLAPAIRLRWRRHALELLTGGSYLWGHVVKSAGASDRPLCPGIDGQPKISKFDLALGSQQNVLRLDVSVNDTLQARLIFISALFQAIQLDDELALVTCMSVGMSALQHRHDC